MFDFMDFETQMRIKKLEKDRLDFGFDSIYFRYAEVVNELAEMKEKEAMKSIGGKPFNRKSWADTKKMHFYNCLEQLLECHPDPIEEKEDAEFIKRIKEMDDRATLLYGVKNDF